MSAVDVHKRRARGESGWDGWGRGGMGGGGGRREHLITTFWNLETVHIFYLRKLKGYKLIFSKATSSSTYREQIGHIGS